MYSFLLALNLLTFTFDISLKKINMIHNKMINIRAFILHMIIFCTVIKVFVHVTLAIFGIGHYWEHLCFTNTSCFS